MENRKDLIIEINKLKEMRNAVILVHNYQPPEIQDLADFWGDSLELSRKAASTDADVIVFCGVRFMAETASILSPNKTVLLPDVSAGCPMADMITAEQLREMKQKYPDALVVTYVNSSAEVKAESDYCCTSGNAIRVVEKVKEHHKRIIFVPDKHLGGYISRKTGQEMIFWEGYCPIHVQIKPEDILKLKNKYPNAKVMVHPECLKEVAALADVVVSTGGMVTYPGQTKAKEIIVGTETGMLYRLQKIYPDKIFISANMQAVCHDMKRITLQKVATSLKELTPEIRVPESIRNKALVPLNRMLQIV